MSENLTWTVNVQVVGGPRIADSNTLEVEAYDKIQVPILAGASDIQVEIQPSSSAGQVKFLMIALTDSETYSDLVTYTVNAPSTDASVPEKITLDAPQFLLKGGVQLLDSAPQRLYFTNDPAHKDISVQILVGRDATPP